MNWFITALQRSFDFRGRSQRAEYWFYALTYVVLAFFVGILEKLIGFSNLSLVYAACFLVPTLAVTARRLHDVGQSGWLQLAPIVFGVLALHFIAAASLSPPSGRAILFLALALAGFVIAQGILLYFLIKDSDAGNNRFGENPKLGSSA